MKISIFTTLGNIGNTPDYWQYAWREAIQSYCDFADEVIVIWGGGGEVIGFDLASLNNNKNLWVRSLPWPYDFSWEQIAQAFNAGLENCTGDWIIKMDIDYVIHEKDMDSLRTQLEAYMKEDWGLCSFMKFTVLNKNRAYQKVHLPFIINKKKLGDTVKFGIPTDDPKSAWGYPIFASGYDKERDLPTGTSIPDDMVRSTGVDIFNYDNTFRNKEITGEHFLRFSDAREKAGFKREWGSTKEEALEKFTNMMRSRIKKTTGTYKPLSLKSHPKYIKDRVENLTPDLYGFNSWR